MKTTFDILSVAARALTYDYVKAHPERPAPHNLSASPSEAARSESVGPEAAPALGSGSFITDASGYAVQLPIDIGMQYLPFGEPKRLLALSSRTPLKIFSESEQTFVDQQNGYDARYTFSAKEKPACRNVSSGRDDETQYSIPKPFGIGARYGACPAESGNSDLSVWLSVDPLSDKYPSLSPYAYCEGNPVMLRDPNGTIRRAQTNGQVQPFLNLFR